MPRRRIATRRLWPTWSAHPELMTSPTEPSPLSASASQASGQPASPVLLSQPLFDEVHDWLASQGPLWRPAGDTIWHLDDWTRLLAGSPLAQAQGFAAPALDFAVPASWPVPALTPSGLIGPAKEQLPPAFHSQAPPVLAVL